MEERFGVERADLPHLEIERRSGDYWLVPKDSVEEYETEVSGLRALRDLDIGLKPTTYLIQLLGDKVQKNLVELSREEFRKLLAREEMIPRDLEEEGYVALRYRGLVVGCGYFKGGVVSSRVPKGRSNELLDIV
ncbi:Ribosome biogenesis protein, NOL1/NOP2/fmu family [Candidatus Nanohalococcus occultus]|uniref:Ribosome biogenesis protein, NOL1/NOP2/fmu family n=1 Tax=Candidatus Nanohalococcus occultus TaxID=2978047 RepID=A0ABY8CHG5_9ARCH|nr:Ribosome biogenesis protein, NOL1/NOP2/fmu family [Candidatus Nanohaloarchaeota archaeon SVXNc]